MFSLWKPSTILNFLCVWSNIVSQMSSCWFRTESCFSKAYYLFTCVLRKYLGKMTDQFTKLFFKVACHRWMRAFSFKLCKENMYRFLVLVWEIWKFWIFFSFILENSFMNWETASSAWCFLINNHFLYISFNYGDFTGGSDCKESALHVGDLGSIP